MDNALALVHPGEILREEVPAPLGMTPYACRAACHVPRTRFERLAAEEVSVSPDTALRLCRHSERALSFGWRSRRITISRRHAG